MEKLYNLPSFGNAKSRRDDPAKSTQVQAFNNSESVGSKAGTKSSRKYVSSLSPEKALPKFKVSKNADGSPIRKMHKGKRSKKVPTLAGRGALFSEFESSSYNEAILAPKNDTGQTSNVANSRPGLFPEKNGNSIRETSVGQSRITRNMQPPNLSRHSTHRSDTVQTSTHGTETYDEQRREPDYSLRDNLHVEDYIQHDVEYDSQNFTQNHDTHDNNDGNNNPYEFQTNTSVDEHAFSTNTEKFLQRSYGLPSHMRRNSDHLRRNYELINSLDGWRNIQERSVEGKWRSRANELEAEAELESILEDIEAEKAGKKMTDDNYLKSEATKLDTTLTRTFTNFKKNKSMDDTIGNKMFK